MFRPKFLPLLTAVSLGLTLVGCGTETPQGDTSGDAAAPADDRRTLNIFMWSEYIDPEIATQFERKFNCIVKIDVYEESEQMHAKMQQGGGDKEYDLVVASDYKVPELAELGLVQALDLSKVPNASNIAQRFAKPSYDPEGKFSLPYQWGTVGIMYRKDVPNFEPTWAMFFDPQRAQSAGPFVLIDEMRDCMSAALLHLGHSINTTDPQHIRAAGDLVLAAKQLPNCQGFIPGVGGKDKVADGSAAMAIVYSGDAFSAMDENEDVGYVVPREGAILWVDAMLIPSQAKDADLAYEFINYILDAQIGAQLSNYTHYGTPNTAAMPYITPEDRANPAIYPPEDVMAKLQMLETVGDATQLYDQVWTAVKSR